MRFLKQLKQKKNSKKNIVVFFRSTQLLPLIFDLLLLLLESAVTIALNGVACKQKTFCAVKRETRLFCDRRRNRTASLRSLLCTRSTALCSTRSFTDAMVALRLVANSVVPPPTRFLVSCSGSDSRCERCAIGRKNSKTTQKKVDK